MQAQCITYTSPCACIGEIQASQSWASHFFQYNCNGSALILSNQTTIGFCTWNRAVVQSGALVCMFVWLKVCFCAHQHSKQYNGYQAVQQLHEFIVPGFVRMDPIVISYTHTSDGSGRRENQTKKQRTNKIHTRTHTSSAMRYCSRYIHSTCME